jgi:hypothetical protein
MSGVILLAFIGFFIPPIGPFLSLAILICGAVAVGAERINRNTSRVSSPRAIVEAELLRETDPAKEAVLRARLAKIGDEEERRSPDQPPPRGNRSRRHSSPNRIQFFPTQRNP